MYMLLNNDMPSFFEMMATIKKCVDFCADDVKSFFDAFSCDADEVEMTAYEELSVLPFYNDFDFLYYEGQDDIPIEDREAGGESWFFSDENIAGCYKLLDELLLNGKITKTEYDSHKEEIENTARECIVNFQGLYEYGAGYYLVTDESEGGTIGIEICCDYSCSFSIFKLYCGIIMFFDKCKREFNQIKLDYCNREILLEAA